MKQSLRARRMARLHRRHKNQPKLNLVSLMDIFTILVFFLLVNSSDVEVLQNNKSIKLPESIAEKKPDTSLVVMVSSDEIIISGRQITTVKAALAIGVFGPRVSIMKPRLQAKSRLFTLKDGGKVSD